MTLSTNIYAEISTTFPASVEGAGGISIAKSGGVYTITLTPADIALNSIALEAIQQIATDRLLGRDTDATGNIEQLTVGGGVEFAGTGIQRSALTGAVTAPAGSNATTIANDAVGSDQIAANAVTLAKLATQADATILANASGGAAVPSAETLTAILDDMLGNTQGNIAYRGSSNWAVLAPGTAGYVLQTGGTGANPSWTSGGSGTFATVAETQTGTSPTLYVNPAGLEGFNRARIKVTRTATQTLTADAWTKVQLTTVVMDSDSDFDATTNYRFTPSIAGTYFVFALGSPNGSNGEPTGVAIYLNGAGLQYATDLPGADGGINAFCFTEVAMNGTTDFLEMFGYASNNASPTITSSAFGAFRISP